MRERIRADDRLVGLHVDAGDARDQPRSAHDLACVDAGVHAEDVATLAQRHHDLFHGGVAGTLAQTVDGALDLPRAGGDSRERVGSRHTQVVVAVHRDDGVLDAVHVLPKPGDQRAEAIRVGVAGRVRDVDHRRTRSDDLLDHPVQEHRLGASGILGVELDVFHEGPRELHGRDRTLDGLVATDAQLVAQVTLAHADAGVDSRPLRRLERVGSGLDVLRDGARQPAHDARIADLVADAPHAFEVSGTRDRKARLDDVDAQPHELPGDIELLVGVHAGARVTARHHGALYRRCRPCRCSRSSPYRRRGRLPPTGSRPSLHSGDVFIAPRSTRPSCRPAPR